MKKSENILVLGLGGVGEHVARRLSRAGHQVTAIENNRDIIAHADAELDVRLIQGDARSFSTWHQAEASKMDYMIAVTDDDTLNILAAIIAKKLGIEQRIARVRTMELWSKGAILTAEDLDIDLLIRPKELAAREVARLLKSSSGNVVIDIGDDGNLQVVAMTVDRDSPMANTRLADLAKRYDDFPFRVVAVARDIDTIIPTGGFVIEPGDRLYIITTCELRPQLMTIAKMEEDRRQNLMIIGGGLIGKRIAQLLQKPFNVRLIEKNEQRAEELLHILRNTEVLHGDGSTREALLDAGLLQMDTIVAATGENETNIMSSVLAKHVIQMRGDDKRARIGKTVALVKKEEYVALASAMDIDIVLDEKVLGANEILRYVRRGHVFAVAHLHGCDAEVVELVAEQGAPITRKPLHALTEVHGRVVIGGLLNEDGKWEIGLGLTQILAGDRVVCICREDDLGDLQRMFMS